MRRTARAVGGVGVIVALLGVAGCGSNEPATKDSTPSGPSTPSTASTASTAQTTPPSSGWVALRDEAGVRFSLPHHVAPESRRGLDPGTSARVYQDKVGEIALSVSVVRTGAAIPTDYPRTAYHQMVAGLTQQGATDTRLSAVGRASVTRGEALDATLTFTATDGSRNYWRMRTITSGHTMVELQALTFSDPADLDAPKRVDAMFTQLADTVALE